MFLHIDIAFRISRIQTQYNELEEVAGKMIAQSDKEKAQYIHTFKRKKCMDARQYDISIDTSKIGLYKSV